MDVKTQEVLVKKSFYLLAASTNLGLPSPIKLVPFGCITYAQPRTWFASLSEAHHLHVLHTLVFHEPRLITYEFLAMVEDDLYHFSFILDVCF